MASGLSVAAPRIPAKTRRFSPSCRAACICDLRLESAKRLIEIDAASRAAGHKGFQGYGIGGYSVGEPHDVMFETLGDVCQGVA